MHIGMARRAKLLVVFVSESEKSESNMDLSWRKNGAAHIIPHMPYRIVVNPRPRGMCTYKNVKNLF